MEFRGCRQPSLKLLKLHRGNLHCFVSKLNAISSLNPVNWVICQMSILSLKMHKSILDDIALVVHFLNSILYLESTDIPIFQIFSVEPVLSLLC